MNDYGVVLFHTTSSALRAERVLLQAGLRIKLIPTPRQFSSDCGIALRFGWADVDAITARLQEAGVKHSGIRRLE